MPKINVLIEGGKATAAAPLGPALGPLGVNVGDVVDKINEKTKSFAGMKVPVEVDIDSESKEFKIKVGTPPMSALIKKELNLKKAASNPKEEEVGNLTIDQLKKIAEQKMDSLTSYKIKSAAREVAGTCNSMGVYVDGKKAIEFLKDMKQGKYDSEFSE